MPIKCEACGGPSSDTECAGCMEDRITELEAIIDDLLSGIHEVGVGLFGLPEDGESWRDAEASWWQSLRKAVAAAEAEKEAV